MPFSLSPAVLVTETDLTNIIPAVSVSTGATCGQFVWGPVEEIQTINNEEQLVTKFGKPSSTNYKDFFTAANFLAYATNLKVVRVVNDATALNSSASASAGGSGVLVKNPDLYESIDFSASTNLWVAKYPGSLGNSIGVAWADSTGFIEVDSNGAFTWPFHDSFTTAPDTNEYHIVIYDADGVLTGTVNTVLETYPFVSSVSTDLYYDGTSAYFKTRINNASNWLWVGKASLLTGSSDGVTLAGGANGSAVTEGERQNGFELFLDTETVDVSLIFAGAGGSNVSQYIIDSIAEVRKDCVAFVSPQEADVVNVFDSDLVLQNTIDRRTTYGSSSYAVMDSAYKYQYDRYNDVNRWVPLNGDIAGLCAKVDQTNDPWFSPGGYNRGKIKNVIKFSHKQPKSFRDDLYKNGINPCFIDRADGAVMLGDKTLLSRPSEFGQIGVRRMFIVIEKAIATASKYFLMEPNDDFTRSRFVNLVVPYLRDVQGRRGIDEFRVVCNSTNNPDNVVAEGRMVGDIWIKPVPSINVIQLSFIATSSSVNFEEIVVAPNQL
jgi:hypothetical protein